MGIKFLCPNGHKLNVKSFLAGKRAICPRCGASGRARGEHARSRRRDVDEHVGWRRNVIDRRIARRGRSRRVSTPRPPTRPPTLHPARPRSVRPCSRLSVAAPRPAPVVDPIAEAPTAVWYVRPASGGQYGPASGDIMRAWLKDGRVGASSLVWRSDWPEWRSASATFPQMSGLAPAGPPIAQPPLPANGASPISVSAAVSSPGVVASPPTAASSPAIAPLAQAALRRRRKHDVRLIASGILVVVSIILIIVLMLVWRSQNASPANPPDEATTAAGPVGDLTPISRRS